jgi:phosphoribosylamine--glycine ligase
VRVLLVGGGGREHALAWKLSQSERLTALYAAPGNPGIARHATCVPIQADALEELARFAERERVDLTVVGPEVPLVLGLADVFESRGLPVFGPTRAAAAIEGSKAFAKDLMRRCSIPTADFRTFTDPRAAADYCRQRGAPVVVKASGLAAGKGSVVCLSVDEAVAATAAVSGLEISGDGRIVVEEFMTGEEASYFVLANGRQALPVGIAQDYKRALDGDQGPNTGGMGAYSPAPVVDGDLADRIMQEIVQPTLAALAADGRPYRGVLYVGLMLTGAGPRVVEFNCRFGDPECQAVLPRLADDLLPLLLACATGSPLPDRCHWLDRAAVCVVCASGGYPGEYRRGLPIAGIAAAEAVPGVRVFHAGTELRAGSLVTAGGRVLGVSASGDDLRQAVEAAYQAIGRISFAGMHFRRDIGHRALSGSRSA